MSIGDEIDRKARQFASNTQRKLQQQLRDAAPVDTGQLRDSIKVHSSTRADGVFFTVEVGAPQGAFTEFGTRPHVILGRPLLAFFWHRKPGGAGFVVLPRVNHPGTKQQLWFARATHAWGSIMAGSWAQS